MELITTLNHKWKALALLSLVFFMIVYSAVADRTENSDIRGAIIIVGAIVTSYVYYVGPRQEKKGLSLKMSFPMLSRFMGGSVQTVPFKTAGLEMIQNDGTTTRFYRLEGPPIGQAQMLDLIKFVSNSNTTVAFTELPVWGSIAMQLHTQDLEDRILKTDNQKLRIALVSNIKGKLKEFDDPSMVALMSVTTKGENEPLVAFENIKFVLIPPEEYFRFFEGEVTENSFKYRLAKHQPVLKNRVAKIFTGTGYVSTDHISDILLVCRRKFAGIQFVTKMYDQIAALKILADERERISINIQKLRTEQKQEAGVNQQLLEKEEKRLALVQAMETIVEDGKDVLYAVTFRLICQASNVKTLDERGKDLIKQLQLKGLIFDEPLEQTSFFEKMITCKDIGNEHSLSILESDLSKIFLPLLRTSQQYIDPKGVFFGTTEHDEPVLLDITTLPSKGIGAVVAKTGIGKSYFLNLLAHEMLLKGWNVVIPNPKGQQKEDLRYDALVNYLGGTSLKIRSINIFDMFEDKELQLAFEQAGLAILSKGIDRDLINVISDRAEKIRESGQIPNFDLLNKQFKKEMSEGVATAQSMIPSLSAGAYSEKVPLGKILRRIGSLAENPVFSETPESLKHLPTLLEVDYSLIDDDFSSAALINLTLEMLWLMKGKPTFILADEIHRIVEENPNLNIGAPNSSTLIKRLATEGRAKDKILVVSAQSLGLYAPENTVMTETEKATNTAFGQISWLLLAGEQQKETLIRLNLLAYETYFKNEKRGKALLLIKGFRQPITVNIKVPVYLHEILTGTKRPLQLSNKEQLPKVIRIDQLEGYVVKDLITREGYVRCDHKELNEANKTFLLPWADDPKRMQDILLCEEFFEKQGVEIEVNYEIGTIRLPWGMLFVQSYKYSHQVTDLINWLDTQSQNWFVVCHKQYQEINDSPIAYKFVMRNEISKKLKYAG